VHRRIACQRDLTLAGPAQCDFLSHERATDAAGRRAPGPRDTVKRAIGALPRCGVRVAGTCIRALAALAAALLAGCTSLPSLDGRSTTFAAVDTDATRLGRAVAASAVNHPEMTGVRALPLGSDAFAARVILADAAERTLDLQYYIWHGDTTGYLLLEHVRRAAERGVRVRLLLDDANTGGLDDVIAALELEPNVQVRLYNPLMHRSARALDFVLDFERVNRRMHNKAFIADNQVAILGGRNVGDEYFGAGDDVAFRDLDAVVAGAAVHAVSREFDLYWNSPSAYPAGSVLAAARSTTEARLDDRFAQARAGPDAVAYLQAVRDTPLLREIMARALNLEWTGAKLVHDDPAKTLETQSRPDLLLLSDLLRIMGRPRASFDLVSPYFVPGDNGTAALVGLAREGVTVRVLTNSLASTDVAFVHAGYAKRRCELLRAGVRLYEVKPSNEDAEKAARQTLGASATTRLHAKTFASDGRRIFIGSFNFDPRSAHLNTEMGLIIESPSLAGQLSRAFADDVPRYAYEVRPTSGPGCMEWIDHTTSGDVHYDTEPGTTAAQRALIDLLSALPIDWLL